ALVWKKRLAPALVTSAAEGCRECKAKNVGGYFRAIMRESLGKSDRNFDSLVRTVKFATGFQFGPPANVAVERSGVPLPKLKIAADQSAHDRQSELVRQLRAAGGSQ